MRKEFTLTTDNLYTGPKGVNRQGDVSLCVPHATCSDSAKLELLFAQHALTEKPEADGVMGVTHSLVTDRKGNPIKWEITGMAYQKT